MSDPVRPPRPLMRLLGRLLPRDWAETGAGDFEEEYADRAADRGRTAAGAWLAFQIVRCAPHVVRHHLYWGIVLLRNYLVITLRDIRRNAFYAFIKVVGLGVGMACAILVVLFVRDELSYDRFHARAERIFRVTEKVKIPTGESHVPFTGAKVATYLREDYPEVRDVVRFVERREFVAAGADSRVDSASVYADPTFLDIFSFPLLRGDRATALRDPDSVLVTETMARTLAGDGDLMGRTVSVQDGNGTYELRVAGIMEDVPANSHFRFDLLGSLDHSRRRAGEDRDGLCRTYLLLDRFAAARELESKLPEFVRRRFGDRAAARVSYHLQPITGIHLHSNLSLETGVNSSLSASYALGLLGLVILLVACVNFVNLSTARAARRSREVGLRKTVGATQPQLVLQFLFESLVLSLLSLVIAALLAAAALPFFNSLAGKAIRPDVVGRAGILLAFFALALLVALFSGLYPSIVLSRYKPVEALRGEVRGRSSPGILIRRALVVFQFAASLVLLIGTITIVRQLDYVKNKDLGFRPGNVISIDIARDGGLAARRELLEPEIGRIPGVEDVLLTDGTPGSYGGAPIQCFAEGASEDAPAELNMVFSGFGFFRFFGVEVLQGRDFDRAVPADASSSVLINESAARLLGWKDPLGKWLKNDFFVDEQGRRATVRVIGVVPDFHNGSLHEPIRPSVYRVFGDSGNLVYVRLRPGRLPETLRALERKWRTLPTRLPFAYKFLGDEIEDAAYRKDIRSAQVYGAACFLAIILACLGAVGQISHAVERRKKEIGIRRVLGASRNSVLALLTGESAGLALTANLLAWPVAYHLMNRWLAGFAYREGLAWEVFAVSAAAILAIAVLTVSVQSLRAAAADPAPIIRNE